MKPGFFVTALAAVTASSLLFNSCSNQPAPQPPDEHGAVTTMIAVAVRLDASGSKTTDTAGVVTVRDTTVVKGKPALEGSLTLERLQFYSVEFHLYDETTSPRKDLTPDIVGEKDYHRFVVTPKGLAAGAVSLDRFSVDSKGAQFGQGLRVGAVQNSSGFLNVALRHYDSGDKTSNLYDTDIDRDIPLTVK